MLIRCHLLNSEWRRPSRVPEFLKGSFLFLFFLIRGSGVMRDGLISLMEPAPVRCACAVSAPRRDVTGVSVMAGVSEAALDTMKSFQSGYEKIDRELSRYPFCIVWTPIPGLTWFLPFIGHMGICTSAGVIRDFAGPYFVSVSVQLNADSFLPVCTLTLT
ncbi:hypothetical protein PDJAM_G00261640 [Pangasius djambal]|nr:hypothetical protein [Pangasius djambal]